MGRGLSQGKDIVMRKPNNDTLMLECIHKGYCKALSMIQKPGFANDKSDAVKNRLLSKKFVVEVSRRIHKKIFEGNHELNVIEVNDKGGTTPGEWLVDACITEGKKRAEFISKVIFAMESESGTDEPAFNEDFAKLVHVKASHKLYLNGLDRPTSEKTDDYIKDRLEYAKQFMNEEDADTFYFGFWPSPGKIKSRARESSIWKEFEQYPHLNKIHLYKFTQKDFHLIGKRQGRLTQK